MSDTVKAHEQTERVEEYVMFPEHVQRSESTLFKHNKHHLVQELNLPCFKCNLKHVGNPPQEAFEHREVHHWLVEWASVNAIDHQRAQQLLDSGFFDPYGFAAKMKGQPFESPDDMRNLVVLCAKHHRDPHVGIHHSTMPEWLSDLLSKEGQDVLLTKEEYEALQKQAKE